MLEVRSDLKSNGLAEIHGLNRRTEPVFTLNPRGPRAVDDVEDDGLEEELCDPLHNRLDHIYL